MELPTQVGRTYAGRTIMYPVITSYQDLNGRGGWIVLMNGKFCRMVNSKRVTVSDEPVEGLNALRSAYHSLSHWQTEFKARRAYMTDATYDTYDHTGASYVVDDVEYVDADESAAIALEMCKRYLADLKRLAGEFSVNELENVA